MVRLYRGPALLTGDLEDIRFLKRRFPEIELSAIAKAIDTHGPRRENVELYLSELSHTRPRRIR
jgi:hypothetical protein